MNIFLWILQVMLALHTLMGAVWKYSNSEQSVPSLSAIPHELWLALGVLEVLLSLALILPAINKRFGKLVPVAAMGIAIEMLIFCVLHIFSGDKNHGQMIYWVVVAILSAFIAYKRNK